MAKAKKTDTLIVKGGGGAVWEVDDTPDIRKQIAGGSLTLIRGAKTAPKEPEAPPESDEAGAGEQAPPESDEAGA